MLVGLYRQHRRQRKGEPELVRTIFLERTLTCLLSPFPRPTRERLEGVYGASVGTSILDAMGVTSEDVVPRGIAMGASAHSIGTAALMEREPEVRPSICSWGSERRGALNDHVLSAHPAFVFLFGIR